MANEFNFASVPGSARAPYAAEEAALQALNETTATALAAAADLADQVSNTFAVANEAEYLRLLSAAADTLFTIVVSGGAVMLAMRDEPGVSLAISLFANGSDFVARKQIGIDNTDDDASLAVDGEIVCNTSGELHNTLAARDAEYQYFDWGNKTVAADLKAAFGLLSKYQKLAIIELCPSQTDTTGSVWTCTSQTAADEISAQFVRLLKKKK